jgi:UDP-glucuronate 4-epimerase
LADGHQVVGLDNFDPFYNPQVKRSNIAGCISKKEFTLIEGDIRDDICVETVLKANSIEMIFHLAAKAGVRPSIENPLEYQDVNVRGTLVVLEAAKKYGVKKFIFASSSSVYGNNEKVPFAETDNVDNPISPYAATKKAGELICYTYSHLYEINMTCLRFFTVYGPRQRPDLAIHKFTKLINDGKPIPVFGDGSMMRDYTYIGDIIEGVIGAMNACKGYEIYNLGESRPIRLDMLIRSIEAALGKKAIINRLPPQQGDVVKTYADVGKAIKGLGYQPKTQLDDGLKKFVEWYRKTQ